MQKITVQTAHHPVGHNTYLFSVQVNLPRAKEKTKVMRAEERGRGFLGEMRNWGKGREN